MWLVVWPQGRRGRRHDLPLAAERHRSGPVWHCEVAGLTPPLEWAWRLDRPPAAAGPPPEPRRMVLDPYARAVSGAERWGEPSPGRRSFMAAHEPGGGGVDRPLPLALPDQVIYELCLRGFTAHPSSGVAAPGTFEGLREKVAYLAALGVTTVELLPLAEWDELEVAQADPLTGEPLRNLWGYSPVAFSAVKAGLAASIEPGSAAAELRALVAALHDVGIAVVLDVVFNHTAERDGRPEDPLFCFGGIDPAGSYLVDEAKRSYRNDTGCGNTVAANQPAMAALIADALRWWTRVAGVDGFRFDLAAVLLRGDGGVPLDDPPLLAAIEGEPALARSLLIAEPWDAGGLYRLGAFARRPRAAAGDAGHGGWGEWNDRFRDDVRRFVRGEPGMAGALAARLGGSEDVFGGAPLGPGHSVNYVACHDGFTLADLVTYDGKHNEANGEGNRDGSDWNASWNCGVEGPTDDPGVLALRRRQVRNLLTLLFLAQGVPMLLAGDERGRSQGGNNNAWCQDNEVGWLDWSRADDDLLRFTRGLIAFRRAHSALRRRGFLSGKGSAASPRPDVAWHGTALGEPDWGKGSRVLAMHLAGEHAPEPDDDVYLAANGGDEEATFALPPPPEGARWLRVVATWEPPPRDLLAAGEEEPIDGPVAVLPGRSCLVLRSSSRSR